MNHQTLPVFVINLDNAVERLESYTSNMEELGIPFHRWPATFGEELDSSKFGVEPIEDGIFVTGFRDWSRNEAACGVSHIKLLQYIVHNHIPWAIVTEDDGILNQNVPLDIRDWNLPEDAEIVMLNDRSTSDEICSVGEIFSYGKLSGGAGTDGYLISHIGASKLLQILYPLRDPLDFQMFAHCLSVQEMDTPPYYWRLPQNPSARNILLQAYKVTPPIVMNSEENSTIGGQRHPRARYYCRVLLGLEFEDDDPYKYFAALLKEPITTDRIVQEFIEWRAVDISHLDESLYLERFESGQKNDPMQLLKNNGVNAVRISIWVDSESKMSLNRALWLARWAHHSGLQIYLALHYSDTWADPTHQAKPAKWRNLSFGELCEVVFLYTMEVMEVMCSQGTPPTIVQIGNEITNGMLWEENSIHCEEGGKLFQEDKEGNHLPYDSQWKVFSKLLSQAIKGVRQANELLGCDAKVMLQIDKGAAPEVAAWWFDRAVAHDVDFDIIGLSYYFLWHDGADLEGLNRLACLSAAFPDKAIMLAETSYPYRVADGITKMPSFGEPSFTPQGQREYLLGTLNAMRKLPNGVGICWWGAFFVNDKIESCEDLFCAQALVDQTGKPLLALSAFKE